MFKLGQNWVLNWSKLVPTGWKVHKKSDLTYSIVRYHWILKYEEVSVSIRLCTVSEKVLENIL
jgi:hypothetical protein